MKNLEESTGNDKIRDFIDIGDTSEGITFDDKGYLYVTSYDKGKVLKVTPDGAISDFAKELIAPAAIAFDCNQNFYVCECGTFFTLPFLNIPLPLTKIPGKLTRITPDGTKKYFTKAYDSTGLFGKRKMRRIKHPNGIAVKSNGVVYVSEMSGFVACIKDNNASILFSFFSFPLTDINLKHSPNGMALSKDEKTLYVNDMISGYIWKVSLDENGNMIEKEKLPLSKSLRQADGIALDEKGYLYITYELKNIAKVDPETGKVEDIYSGDELNTPANIAFGNGEGFDNKSLYITQLGLRKDIPKEEKVKIIKKMYIGTSGLVIYCHP
jgi:sugar lactone lactonase YvrE